MLHIKRKVRNDENSDYEATSPPEKDNRESSIVLPAPKKRRRRVVSSRTVTGSDKDMPSCPQIRLDMEESEPAPFSCERCDRNGDECMVFPRRPRGRQRLACVKCPTIRKACSLLDRAGLKKQAHSRRKLEKSRLIPYADGGDSDMDDDPDRLNPLDSEGVEEDEEEIVKTKGKGKAKAKTRSRQLSGMYKTPGYKMEEDGPEWLDGRSFISFVSIIFFHLNIRY